MVLLCQKTQIFFRARGKYFTAIVGYDHRMLPLSGQFAVFGNRCPLIWQDFGLPRALVNHRLNGKGHARL